MTDRIGMAGVELIVNADLNWIFREQPTDDYGIDAQIEVVVDQDVTGKLIALQVKSGPSYFKPTTDGSGWWFYPEPADVDYWLRHSLPVIVVFFDPASRIAYWVSVAADKLVTTRSGGRKILIPAAKTLSPASKTELSALADANSYELRMRQLRLSLPWMKLISGGRRILVEVEEWVNKSSGRGGIELVSVDAANEDRIELGSWTVFLGLKSYAEAIPQLFPWAHVEVHAETYDQADGWEWDPDDSVYNEETDQLEYGRAAEWDSHTGASGLRPYANAAGEVDRWRLELRLNDLARAFMLVDEFAEQPGRFIAPVRA